MPWTNARPPSNQRGMGAAHQSRRRTELAQLQANGIGQCCIGGEPIYAEHIGLPNAHPLKPVLDHCPCRTGCHACGGTGYRGLACWRHNAQDGSRRGRARQTVTALRM